MDERPLRVLEFYSGIGGMRYALEQIPVSAKVVEAFEINDMANDVYEYNFGHRPNQGNIQHLTMQQLDEYKADVWLLSPPCQPYTRQGLQKDADDARAGSFLWLLEMLPHMSNPPTHLFVENVVGFECSVTRDHLCKALKASDFSRQEFILTPLQLGIPYSRPRYFCLAKRRPFGFLHPHFDDRLLYDPGPVIPVHAETPCASDLQDPLKLCEAETGCDDSCTLISQYLDKDEEVGIVGGNGAQAQHHDVMEFTDYAVPESLIDRWGDAFDVVTPSSKKCCCFTKSYGRYVKGTGSLLATKPQEVDFCEITTTKSKSLLKRMGLRYFTPREVANLHSFPKKFKFPDHISLKQRYALLGNSLSVAVVAVLLHYLFQEMRGFCYCMPSAMASS